MRIENTVEVDAPLDRVWALVNDIPQVAPCMPGAALTGVVDDKTYEGRVEVKLGPLRMSYKGKVVIEEVDEAAHSARLTASGRDTKGAGTAKASVVTLLEPASDTRTRLNVTSDVQLTGKVASFGRGGAINDVASRLFGQFADCLRTTLEAETATTGAAGAAAAGATGVAEAGTTGAAAAEVPTPAAAEPALASEPVAAGDGTTAADVGVATPAPIVTPGSAPISPAPAPISPAPAARPVEALDAGSLAGAMIKGRLVALFQAIAGFFRRLFGRRSG